MGSHHLDDGTLETVKMRHIPAYCPEVILSVRPGDILAGCDWKEIVFLGGTHFAIWHKDKARTVRKRGFAEARNYYNSLPYPERLKRHS